MAMEQIDKVIDEEISGSPICEAVKNMANVLFEGVDYTDPSQVYNELAERKLFTDAELELVTNGWGLNMDTLDKICQVRFTMDADQVLAEN
jgi:ethanolamine utilization protein EutA (predicted chaperonin)